MKLKRVVITLFLYYYWTCPGEFVQFCWNTTNLKFSQGLKMYPVVVQNVGELLPMNFYSKDMDWVPIMYQILSNMLLFPWWERQWWTLPLVLIMTPWETLRRAVVIWCDKCPGRDMPRRLYWQRDGPLISVWGRCVMKGCRENLGSVQKGEYEYKIPRRIN